MTVRSTINSFCLAIAFLVLPAIPAMPDDGSSDERLAAQFFREGRYDEAAALYAELINESTSPLIYNNYLESLLQLEEFRQAERLVRDRMDARPEAVRYAVDQAWVDHRAGNDRRARRRMDRLIRDVEADYQQIVDLAMAFETRGFQYRALETYLHGRELLGAGQPLHLRIAAILEKKGDYGSMMREYVDYLNHHEDDLERARGLLQDAIADDPGFERNDALRELLLRRTQREPDNVLYPEMLLWLSLQQQDFRMALRQARALDRRFRREGETVLEVARLATNNRHYETAADAFRYLLDLGEEGRHYMDALVGNLHVRFLSIVDDYTFDIADLSAIEAEYQDAIGRLGVNATTVQLVRNLANLQAFYLGNTGEAIRLLESTLELPNVSNRVKGECRIELADILLLTGEVWDATLLYSQVDRMFRDDPIAHEARFKNARLTYFIGEFDWAKAQLDVLKAGTSRFIANDAMRLSLRIQDNLGINGDPVPLKMFARAEQHVFMNNHEDALLVLDSVGELFPGHQINDDLLFLRSEIRRTRGDYPAADSLLAAIVERYPAGLLADEALFQRAELYHHYFDKPDKAMSLYQKLIIDYPGSLHAVTARNRFRKLRGDLVN